MVVTWWRCRCWRNVEIIFSNQRLIPIFFFSSFAEGAIRETLEEGGIKVELKGILRVERSARADFARMR